MKKIGSLVMAGLVLGGAGILSALAQGTVAKDIPSEVAKAFDKQCAGCHSGLFAPKGLKLSPSKIASAIDAPSKEMPKLKLIDTADPAASYLLKKIEGAADISGVKMPKGRELAAADFELIKAWLLGLKAK